VTLLTQLSGWAACWRGWAACRRGIRRTGHRKRFSRS